MAKVLFVENHAKFAEIVCQRFLASHQVTAYPSVQLAREAIECETFEFVLLDYDLDDGKGTELLKTLLPLHPPRPLIIAVSSHEDGNQAILDAGADGCCGKLEFHRIEEVMQRLLMQQGN